MSWLDKYKILSYRINPADYPDYTCSDRVSDVPGLVLCEQHAVRGIRYAVTTGCAVSVAYFYGVVRPRLPFADRSLVKLHHYFYPSAGYTTPIGLSAGLLYGVYAEGQWVDAQSLSPSAPPLPPPPPPSATARAPVLSDTLREEGPAPSSTRYASVLARDQIARESRAARAAHQQYVRHRDDVEAELRKGQLGPASRLSSLRQRLGLGGADPVLVQLAKLGLAAPKQWTDFVEPYGLLWTRLHSSVHDARFYKDYTGPVVVAAAAPVPVKEAPVAHATARGKAPPPSPATSTETGLPVAGPPPTTPLFTKEQVDVVVSRATCLRRSPDENRWSRSAGRFATYGIATTVLAWNSGNVLFRVSMGLGLGVVAGAMVSATRLDDAFKHL